MERRKCSWTAFEEVEPELRDWEEPTVWTEGLWQDQCVRRDEPNGNCRHVSR